MHIATVGRREWSAKELGWLMSFIGCTTCATIAIAVMVIFLPPSGVIGNTRWFDIIVVVFLSYSQLMASTLHHSPVERKGDVVEGMIFGELGDDYVRGSVRSWMWFWFSSPFLHSVMFVLFGILFLYGVGLSDKMK